jgi:hypothetical protein
LNKRKALWPCDLRFIEYLMVFCYTLEIQFWHPEVDNDVRPEKVLVSCINPNFSCAGHGAALSDPFVASMSTCKVASGEKSQTDA